MKIQKILTAAWRDPACLGLAVLATLPPAALESWQGWDFLSPQSILAETLWLPLACWCQVALLARLGEQEGLKVPRWGLSTLFSVLGSQILFSLRFSTVVLLAALPALLALSWIGLETPIWRWLPAGLALAGAGPVLAWTLRRFVAPAVVLWQGLKAAPALDESARLSAGKLKTVLLPLFLWSGLALVLETSSEASLLLGLLAFPLSLLLSQAVLLWTYRRLTL